MVLLHLPYPTWPSTEALKADRGGGYLEYDYGGYNYVLRPDGYDRWQVSVIDTTGDVYASCYDEMLALLVGLFK